MKLDEIRDRIAEDHDRKEEFSSKGLESDKETPTT